KWLTDAADRLGDICAPGGRGRQPVSFWYRRVRDVPEVTAQRLARTRSARGPGPVGPPADAADRLGDICAPGGRGRQPVSFLYGRVRIVPEVTARRWRGAGPPAPRGPSVHRPTPNCTESAGAPRRGRQACTGRRPIGRADVQRSRSRCSA